MPTYPAHEDLGLVDNDMTEDMRKAPAVTEALRSDRPISHHNHQGDLNTMKPQTECKHCTVKTEGTDVCAFCANYTPPTTPAQQLDVAINRVDLLRADLNVVLDQLPGDAPLFACADLTTAICHLKRAAVALGRASDLLEADARAVLR